MPGRSAVSGQQVVRQRRTGSQQRQHTQRVDGQLSVRNVADPEGMTRLPLHLQTEAVTCRCCRRREIEDVHRPARGGFGSDRPRIRAAFEHDRTTPVSQGKGKRLLRAVDKRGPHRSTGLIADLVDPNRRTITKNAAQRPHRPTHAAMLASRPARLPERRSQAGGPRAHVRHGPPWPQGTDERRHAGPQGTDDGWGGVRRGRSRTCRGPSSRSSRSSRCRSPSCGWCR